MVEIMCLCLLVPLYLANVWNDSVLFFPRVFSLRPQKCCLIFLSWIKYTKSPGKKLLPHFFNNKNKLIISALNSTVTRTANSKRNIKKYLLNIIS